VKKLLVGLLGVVMAAGQLCAATNAVVPSTNSATALPNPDDPAEKEYKKLMADDDAAQNEVDTWLRDNEKFTEQGAGVPAAEMSRRIRERLTPVGNAYVDFLKRHPDHARARVAYGSFLNDLQDEDGAQEQWEKALALNPKDPAVYNNLANLYSHTGSVKKAFEYYAKAIELSAREPLYYHNMGDTVFLFRKDAREFYGITEQQVFDKALGLYAQALKLAPRDFPLASDVAQTYYGIRPLRIEEALKAWTNTLAIAQNEIEREGVYLHFARLNLIAGRFAQARAHLTCVTNETYHELKERIARNVDTKEKEAQNPTNSPAAKAPVSLSVPEK
jgi:tetratricopeptide (TPR) repeat protein